jgi:ABC-2 type transport system ATP-binding protein
MPAIEIKGLTKQYPVPLKREAVNAVSNLNLAVEEGEIFGFLGPNGAGKTTTIKMLLGLIYPTAGEAYVLGAPAGDIAVKRQIAYLPESPYFYEHLTAREVVRFYAQLFGMKREEAARRTDELLNLVGLQADSRKPLRQFSKGMLQRVGIAQSLLNRPRLLFYDEPTSGLDAIARRDIRDLILHLKGQGITMFLSSHQMEDVEMLCDRVSIIHRGVLQKMGRVEDLVGAGRVEIVATGLRNGLTEKIRAVAADARFVDSQAVINQPDEPEAVARIVDLIRDGRGQIVSITPKKRRLEDIFVETVGERMAVPTAEPVPGRSKDKEIGDR